jgi:uncharacterized protein YydD (DUF2326 family)
MRLLELTSSNENFRTLKFKPGLNIIIGKKSTDENKDTYNGVGKSLSNHLIHYMLGGSLDKCLSKNLNAFNFQLKFKHNEHEYEIIRDVSQKNVILNQNNYKIGKYLSFLDNLFLDKKTLQKNITFRGLFSRFTRDSRDAYTDPILQITTKENGFINNKYNSYLLGLDDSFIDTKDKLKKRKDILKNLQNNIKDSFFKIDSSVMLDLEDEIKEIEERLKNFKIAEDYNAQHDKADKITEEINKKRNIMFRNEKIINIKLKNIEKSPDIKIDVIRRLYEEAKFFFNELVEKELRDVEEFHRTLLENRFNKFNQEINFLKNENEKIKYEINDLDNERAKIFNTINNSGALEEYNGLNLILQQLKEKRVELKQNEDIIKKLKQQGNELKFEIDAFNKQIYEYYLGVESKIKEIQKLFRQITKYFYDKHSGTIEINVNDNLKANRVFNIIPKIQDDRSDGIKEIVIFAYDMLLYELNNNLFNFVSHDSRLFDPIDPRQIAKAFEYILEKTTSNGLQYFCSLNKNIFESMINELKNDEIKKQIKESVIMELSENNKLFGFNFDC